jgi:ATP-dependent DNA ligase
MFTIPMRPRNLPRRLPSIREFILQPKYDGWYVVFLDGRAYTRTGEDITHWACWSGRTLPDNAVGELMNVHGRAKVASLATSADGLRVVLFDVPGPEPLEERLAKLPEVALQHGFEAIDFCEVGTWECANDLLGLVQMKENIEGFVLKRRASAWTSGEGHKDWYRFKAPVEVQ